MKTTLIVFVLFTLPLVSLFANPEGIDYKANEHPISFCPECASLVPIIPREAFFEETPEPEYLFDPETFSPEIPRTADFDDFVATPGLHYSNLIPVVPLIADFNDTL